TEQVETLRQIARLLPAAGSPGTLPELVALLADLDRPLDRLLGPADGIELGSAFAQGDQSPVTVKQRQSRQAARGNRTGTVELAQGVLGWRRVFLAIDIDQQNILAGGAEKGIRSPLPGEFPAG